MKPSSFDFLRPKDVPEVCQVLADDPEARVLAGGQTLIPMLAMRLARPTTLVDVNRLPQLHGITEQGAQIRIGAATVQAKALHSDLLKRQVPLLAKALAHVGHPPTRARGTVGGSVAHGDPSAEICLAAAVLDAEIVYATAEGEERFAPEEFFIGPMLTTAPAGCLTELLFPKCPTGRVGTGFHETASRRSDYAFASAAAQVVLDEDGRCIDLRLGIGAVGDVPQRLEAEGQGMTLTDARIAEIVAAALEDLETVDDLHATAAYRRRAAAELARRALREARDDAMGDIA